MQKKIPSSKFYNILINQVPISKNKHIYFTKLSLTGLEEMHNYSINPKLYEFLGYKPFKNINTTKKYLKKLINNQKKNSNNEIKDMGWFIRRKTDNRLIGTARLTNIKYSVGHAEWGWGIDPDLWGSGYILDIMEALKEYVFIKLTLNRLWGQTWKKNKRTIASIKLAGMEMEGVHKDGDKDANGKYQDTVSYGIVAKKYFEDIKKIHKKKKLLSQNEIKKIIRKTLGLQINSKINSMESTRNWDSLSHINVILAIEKKIKYKFNAIEIAQSNSVENIYNIINKK
ncbi:MAG: hypothetical protein CMI95_01825 [Pelagibacteraceae bacterium]|nr:hypothetical protein [Pelagibacteraceae bacterium]PPR51283.1 MAG: hypothetical protein CFH20_00709 [Alphaproteobacteria bacterium MarineAlpha5_Bin10]|tara:strand:+ start:24841 stop:25695 length:855 start_codon:yes stop_codon:yes gene_type:complete